jgi:hypothetical protein
MKGVVATVLASIAHTVGIMCLLGLAATANGPIGPAQFAIMAGAGVVLGIVVFLVWFAGMAIRWVFGVEVDE